MAVECTFGAMVVSFVTSVGDKVWRFLDQSRTIRGLEEEIAALKRFLLNERKRYTYLIAFLLLLEGLIAQGVFPQKVNVVLWDLSVVAAFVVCSDAFRGRAINFAITARNRLQSLHPGTTKPITQPKPQVIPKPLAAKRASTKAVSRAA